MPSILMRILLFLSSYFPLFLIFTIQNHNKYGNIALIPVTVGTIALIGLSIFMRWVGGSADRREVVVSVQRKDSEVMSYIVTYIIPFMGLDLSSFANLFSLCLFFFMLMIIYINTNLIHINPMMNIVGFHIYEIENKLGTIHTIISRKSRLVKDDKLNIVMIGDNLFMEK